jgi:predicted neuraminidase
MRRLSGWLLIALAAWAGWHTLAQRPAPSSFQPLAHDFGSASSSVMRSQFVSPDAGPHRHAASMVELADGRLRAFWFSGSREGAPDVEIRTAVFDPRQNRWQDEAAVIDRAATQTGLWRSVRRLGNPVPARTADGPNGRLHLFYVTVSLGGWAGSSITRLSSTDDGQTWSAPQRLITSPFLNVSTLVKGAPFLYADGSIGLPVYHEFIGKFGELLRLDAEGRVLDKQRLSHGRGSLQPVVLVQDAQRAQVLMRHAGPSSPNRVIGTATADAGRHWTPAEKTTLANPSAAVAGVVLPDGTLLAALNDIESDRDALSLLASRDDGKSWTTLAQLEDQRAWRGKTLPEAEFRRAMAQVDAPLAESAQRIQCRDNGCSFEFSYPYLTRAANGDLHLLYTWNRSAIRHLWLPRGWLEAKLKEAAP